MRNVGFQAVHFRDLEIRILNLFRISKFELRISKGKLNHFVNGICIHSCYLKTEISTAAVEASAVEISAEEQEFRLALRIGSV